MVYYWQDNILVFFLTEELNKHDYNVCRRHVEIIICFTIKRFTAWELVAFFPAS